jgi:parallel beta-helix repeat protein
MDKKMRKGLVLGLVLVLVAAMFVVVLPMNVSAAPTTVVIKSTGEVDPGDAPIKIKGDKYILTDDIEGNIVIEKSGIILDGAGHTIYGSSTMGIYMEYLSGVTIKNCYIDDHFVGIQARTCTNSVIKENTLTRNTMAGIALWYGSNYNLIQENTVKDNGYGIVLIRYNDYNIIRDNMITENANYGFDTLYSDHNTFKENDIIESGWAGMTIRFSEFNTIKDNTIDGHTSYGIRSYYSTGDIFEDNTIINNRRGINFWYNYMDSINENSLSNNNWGIQLYYCEYFKVNENTIMGSIDGMDLWYSENCVLRENIFKNNEYHFDVGGGEHDYYIHDIDDSNKIEGKPIIYWVNEHSKSVPKNIGFLALVDCTEITVKDITLKENDEGLLMVSSDDCMIENVMLKDNFIGFLLIDSNDNTFSECTSKYNDYWGIWLTDSSGNVITECTFSGCGLVGALLESSSGNELYYNNFKSNTAHASDDGTNTWDDGSGMGNYYDDYTGEDLNNDGVGDTLLPHYYDSYPLMKPY